MVLAGCSDDPATTASAPSTTTTRTDPATVAQPGTEPTPTTERPEPAREPTPTAAPTQPPTTTEAELEPVPAQPESEPATTESSATAESEPATTESSATAESEPATTESDPESEPTTQPDPASAAEPEPTPSAETESGTTRDDQRPVPILLAGSDGLAPEWPFRGMVWTFTEDVDGEGGADLIVQYHRASDRSFTELVISDFDSSDTTCSASMLATEEGLAVYSSLAAEPRLVIPWGAPPTRDQDPVREITSSGYLEHFARPAMSLGLVQASVVSTSAGRWLTMGGAGIQYSHHFGIPYTDPDGFVYPSYLRGSDGEFLAVAFTEPGVGGLCDRQHTYVISMKTGEVVACGYHKGHLAFIMPPASGLLVERIVMPSAGFFTPQQCRLSLQEEALWPAAQDELPSNSLAGYLSGLPVPSGTAPDQPAGPEKPQSDDQEKPQAGDEPEEVEPPTEPEVVVKGSPAPEWPFRGLVEVDYSWGQDGGSNAYIVRYLSSRDRTVTEMTIEGLEPFACAQASIDRVSKAGITMEAWWDTPDGTSVYVTIAIPWGETAEVVTQHPFREGDASWRELLTSAWDLAHGYVIGGAAFDVSVHANGLRLLAGESAENYEYETWGSSYPENGDSPPPESIELHGDILATLDDVYFLGTDGEFVGFATRPYEPACAPAAGYLISMRTGQAFACGFVANGIALVQPSQEGLLVEEVALPSNRMLREDCSNGNLAERWASLPAAPVPYAPKPGPAAPKLPTATAPQWPFRGAVVALQRYVPHLFSYETVLQYRSSDDGSVTELVFGPMRSRSRDLAIEADEHGVEVWRRDWAVTVPWGDAAELVDIESATVRPARTTTYPTLMTFGWRETSIEIESFIAREQISRLTIGPHWAGGQRSWYVWSAPEESLINTRLEISSRHSGLPVWLRGTDGRVMAISRQDSSEMCGYLCDPVLTVLISLETGQVLSCGVELDGANALAFVAPAGSSLTPDVKLPPSGWLDPDPCLSQATDDARHCSWVWSFSPVEPRCGRLFELAAPDGAGVVLAPAWIQADLDRLELLIQPEVGE